MAWKPDQERYIFLYCHSRDQKKRYEQLAKAIGTSLNKFLLSKIEDSLNPKPVIDLKELIALQEENKKLREELKISKILVARYEDDLKKVKASPTVEINKHLLKIFQKEQKPLSEEDLAERLRFTGTEEEQDLSFIEMWLYEVAEQLEIMERVGLIKRVARGWIWNGY